MTAHEWRLSGAGESARYVCTKCGAVENAFRESYGPDGMEVTPSHAGPTCEEETVRYVLEE